MLLWTTSVLFSRIYRYLFCDLLEELCGRTCKLRELLDKSIYNKEKIRYMSTFDYSRRIKYIVCPKCMYWFIGIGGITDHYRKCWNETCNIFQ